MLSYELKLCRTMYTWVACESFPVTSKTQVTRRRKRYRLVNYCIFQTFLKHGVINTLEYQWQNGALSQMHYNKFVFFLQQNWKPLRCWIRKLIPLLICLKASSVRKPSNWKMDSICIWSFLYNLWSVSLLGNKLLFVTRTMSDFTFGKHALNSFSDWKTHVVLLGKNIAKWIKLHPREMIT